jgi:hypothetical protein
MKSAAQTLAASIALLDEAVRVGADARHDPLDAAVLVANTICVSVVSKSTAPRLARALEQRAVHLVQVLRGCRQHAPRVGAASGRACWRGWPPPRCR